MEGNLGRGGRGSILIHGISNQNLENGIWNLENGIRYSYPIDMNAALQLYFWLAGAYMVAWGT